MVQGSEIAFGFMLNDLRVKYHPLQHILIYKEPNQARTTITQKYAENYLPNN